MCWLFDSPSLHPHHINTKELAAVLMGALRWCHLWVGHHVIMHTDSTVTQGVINKGSARNTTCLHLLQLLASLAVDYGFTISAEHIPGHNNVLADTISRLHEPGSLAWQAMLHAPSPPSSPILPSPHVVKVLVVIVSGPCDNAVQWLDAEVASWRAHVFSEATKSTYSSHLRAFLRFCAEFSLTPCPAPTSTLLRYAAFPARSKCYSSVTQYLNII